MAGRLAVFRRDDAIDDCLGDKDECGRFTRDR
jgi:hypothetical protein